MSKIESNRNQLPKEIINKQLSVTAKCHEDGKVDGSQKARLKGIKTPSGEHIWLLSLRCNQGGNHFIACDQELHFQDAQQALDFAICHPDAVEIIKTWKNIDWSGYGNPGQRAYPTQYEIQCIHPVVYNWGLR